MCLNCLNCKRKTGQEVANAFSSILKERRPSKRWVDSSREFDNKDVQKLVELYSTENEEKSCVNESFNRTIKKKCLSISLLIMQENMLMYLIYFWICTIIHFIPR